MVDIQSHPRLSIYVCIKLRVQCIPLALFSGAQLIYDLLSLPFLRNLNLRLKIKILPMAAPQITGWQHLPVFRVKGQRIQLFTSRFFVSISFDWSDVAVNKSLQVRD